MYEKNLDAAKIAVDMRRDVSEEEGYGQVPNQIQRQGGAVHELHDAIIFLSKKLEEVLRQEAPEKESTEPSLREALVPLAERIERNNDGIMEAARLIRNLTDRLEL